jgi:hypothetical protein
MWVEEGQNDYPEMLFRSAYDMLRLRKPSFDDSDTALTVELRDWLIVNKYLVKKDTQYLFRHDLIRSYLASEYFGTRWRELLDADDAKVDDNWRPMLEFVLLKLTRPEEAQGLMEAILAKNERTAGKLFKWMQGHAPNLCEGWSTRFKLKFADEMLDKG